MRFIERNYLYKSVATQIPDDAELTPIPYTGQKFQRIIAVIQLTRHSVTSTTWLWSRDKIYT